MIVLPCLVSRSSPKISKKVSNSSLAVAIGNPFSLSPGRRLGIGLPGRVVGVGEVPGRVVGVGEVPGRVAGLVPGRSDLNS